MDAAGHPTAGGADRGSGAAACNPTQAAAPAWARTRRGTLLGVAAAVLTGLLLTAAFPEPDIGALAFVALVPLLAFTELAGLPPPRAARLGYLAGVVFFALHMRWISELGANRPAGMLAWAALTALQACVPAAFFACVAATADPDRWLPRQLRRSPAAAIRAGGLVAVWVALEQLRSHVPFGGNAWGLLGVTQHDGGPLLGLARVVGMFGLSAVIVTVNLALTWTLTSLRRRRHQAGPRRWAPAAALAALAVGLPLSGLLAPGLPPADGDAVRLAVVQGNASFTSDNRGRTSQAVFQRHLDGTHALAGSGTPLDLVVWGEGSADNDPLINPDRRLAIQDASAAAGAPVIVGATTVAGDDRYHTEALLFGPGGLQDRYVKRRLLPFGEFVPMSGVMRQLVPATNQLPYDKVPGDELPVMRLDGVPFGTIICYESAYPGDARSLVRDGAQFVVLITNNASFGWSWLAPQHLASTQLRAVEQGRAMVHAAVSGISGVVAPDGTIEQASGLYEEATIIGEIQPRTGLTAYARGGHLIEPALAAAGAATVVLLAGGALHHRRRGRRGGTGEDPGSRAHAVPAAATPAQPGQAP